MKAPAWEIQPVPWGHAVQEKDPVKLGNITLDQFNTIISKATPTNQERTADAIRRADSASFVASNPWFKVTKTNTVLLDNWLEQNHITWPMYADFAAGTEALCAAGLLDVSEAEYAQHLDGNTPQKFYGTYTKREYNNLDSLIAEERQAVIQAQGAEKQTDLQSAFDRLPIDEAQQLLRDAEKQAGAVQDGKISAANAASWLTLHSEWRDDTYNGRLMASQLKINGVVNRPVEIADYELAERQLVASGLVHQNPAALRKQEEAEVVERAQRAVKNSAAFDNTTEDAMYELPLDEVRRRANGNYTGVGF